MTDPNGAPVPGIADVLGEDPRPRAPWRRLAWGGGLLAVLLAALAWGTRGPAPDTRYETQEVGRGALSVTVTATGTLAPTNQVDVGSELSGIVKTVPVDFNDTVTVGQVLLTLDTTRLDAQVLQSRAALEAARARRAQAEATRVEAAAQLGRLKAVWEASGRRIPSRQDLDAAQAAFDRATADRANADAAAAQAQAALEAIQTDLSKTVIHSPIKGIVLKRAVEPGQTVAAAFQAPVLFTLAEDLRKMELHVDVDEADVGQVAAGQGATFAVDAYPDREYPARVVQVRYGAQTVGGVVTYETVLNVDNADLSLRPGMTATADILVQRIGDALLVPNAALRFAPVVRQKAPRGSGGGFMSKLFPRPPRPATQTRDGATRGRGTQRVWVLDAKGAPAPVTVTPGATDGAMTVIVAGDLKPGMAVVVDTLAMER